jgi:hypothetical protein
MAKKTIAAILTLSAFAVAGANPASADDGGFRGGGFRDGGGGSFHGGGFRGRGFHKRGSPVVVGGYLDFGDNYGSVGGNGYVDSNGYGNGTGDWYGLSSGHEGCTLFRRRVMTPEGWRIQMVPVC